jgi:hypothetical protein
MCIHRCRFVILVLTICLLGSALEGRAQSQSARNDEVLTLEQAMAIALRDNLKVQNAALDVSRSQETDVDRAHRI